MAFTVQQNRKNTSAVIHITGSNTVTIAGNSTVSDVAIGNEVLTGCTITQVFCGSSSGNGAYWTIKRGANTVAVLDSTGYFDYAGAGMALSVDSGGTLEANLINGTDGYLLIEIQKQGTLPSDYVNP